MSLIGSLHRLNLAARINLQVSFSVELEKSRLRSYPGSFFPLASTHCERKVRGSERRLRREGAGILPVQ